MARGNRKPTQIRSTSRLLAVLALASALVLAACGSDDGDDAAADTTSGGSEASKTVTIGWIPWDEDIAVTHLWKNLLEEQGYEVELTNVDVAPLFQGLADGDIDLFFDSWLPDTHGDHWEAHGDKDIVQLGTWFDNGTLNLAVPDYVDIDTFDDLKDNAEMFDSQIIGIEPGAGTMRRLGEEVMPGYGLDDWTLVESSTPTMLTELEAAIDNEEPIVVVLWHPHWAYANFPIKDLEDTLGLFGEGEEIVTVANKDYAEANPEIAEWFANFKMDDESLGTLETLVLHEHEGDEAAGVQAWLEDPDNAALAQSWIDG